MLCTDNGGHFLCAVEWESVLKGQWIYLFEQKLIGSKTLVGRAPKNHCISLSLAERV